MSALAASLEPRSRVPRPRSRWLRGAAAAGLLAASSGCAWPPSPGEREAGEELACEPGAAGDERELGPVPPGDDEGDEEPSDADDVAAAFANGMLDAWDGGRPPAPDVPAARAPPADPPAASPEVPRPRRPVEPEAAVPAAANDGAPGTEHAADAEDAPEVAVVADEPVPLRASARGAAPAVAQLWRGELLEVRGAAPGFLRVYDHRRERPGWVRPAQVRRVKLAPSSAPGLVALALFLRDQPGSEGLGISLAQLARQLEAPRAGAAASPLDDAIGAMSDRLARRASQRAAVPDPALAAALEVVEARGVHLVPIEHDGRVLLCSDGAAERRALSLGDAAEKARAALLLTDPRCGAVAGTPARRWEWNLWRSEVAARADPERAARADEALAARLRLRRAAIWSELVSDRARRADPAGAAAEAASALRELALVERARLPEEDLPAYDEAAVRVSAARHAAAEGAASGAASAGAAREALPGAVLALQRGVPGETCLRLTAPADGALLFERCTPSLLWPSSLRASPRGDALALVAQPLPAWTELWILRRAGGRWSLEVRAPSTDGPGVGAIEPAGFTPDGAALLVAREALVQGKLQRRFEVLAVRTLQPLAHAERADDLRAFRRHASPAWRSATLALR